MRSSHWLSWLLLPLAGFSLAAAAMPTAKIIGGADATESYPWMAGLHEYLPIDDKYIIKPFCGGSLIAPGWIVSAAHCFTAPGDGGDSSLYSPQAYELIIRLNSPDLSDDPEYFVSQIIAHPQYGVADGSDDSDIVLIKLASKVSFEAISVADEYIMTQLENSTVLDDVVQVVGWGVYDDEYFDPSDAGAGNSAAYLQSVRLDYRPFSNKKCRKAWGGLTENMICAWEPQPDTSSPFGEDACFGDSGGPLMLPKNTQLSSFRSEHHWLLGVTSFGSTKCNSRKRPGIYTHLAKFEQWLENTSKNSGDGLVDVQALLELPSAVQPQQTFNFVAGMTNSSKLNSVSSAVLEVSATDTTLVPPSGHGCIAIIDGWRCAQPALLEPGEEVKLTFSATWLGADDQSLQVNVHAYDAGHDDYRIANNNVSGNTDITLLPDPALNIVVISNRDGRANITATASCISSINSVTNARLIITLPADLNVTAPTDCDAVGIDQFSCALGTLAPESSVSVDLALQGSGTFSLPLSLQSDNGDIHPGDTSQTLNITLKRSSSSGSAALLLPLLLLLYRRRNWRNHASN